MRRAILTFCVFLLLGVAVAVMFHNDPGQMLIALGPWRMQTSLAFALIALIVTIWLVLVLRRLIVSGVMLPGRITQGWSSRRSGRQHTALIDGLGRVIEQRWRAAETQLKRVDDNGTLRGVARLAAACSAARQNRAGDCARYLDDARRAGTLSELAVELTAAELAVQAGEHDIARARLARLNEIAPHHPRVLALYADELERDEAHSALRELLPDLGKHGDVTPARCSELARVAWSSALADNADHAEALISAWARVPGEQKNDSSMIETYVRHLHAVGADQEAGNVIREVLSRQWTPALATLYGQLAGDDTESRLADAEQWLRRYGNKPELLLLAGRLCLRSQLWGRARHYFEQSQEQETRSDVLLELGSLYEQTGELDNARSAYRHGLALQISD